MMLRRYKALVLTGHVGAGKSGEVTWYIEAPDMAAALSISRRLPGAKRGQGTPCADIEEYEGRPPGRARGWYWRK